MCRVAAANVVADGVDVVYRPLVRWAGGEPGARSCERPPAISICASHRLCDAFAGEWRLRRWSRTAAAQCVGDGAPGVAGFSRAAAVRAGREKFCARYHIENSTQARDNVYLGVEKEKKMLPARKTCLPVDFEEFGLGLSHRTRTAHTFERRRCPVVLPDWSEPRPYMQWAAGWGVQIPCRRSRSAL